MKTAFLVLLIMACVSMAGFIAWEKVVVPQGWDQVMAQRLKISPKQLGKQQANPTDEAMRVMDDSEWFGPHMTGQDEKPEGQPLVMAESPMPKEPTLEAQENVSKAEPAPLAQEPMDVDSLVVSPESDSVEPEEMAEVSRTTSIEIFEPSLPKPVGVIPHGWKMEVIKDQEAQSYPVPLPGGRLAEISSLPYEIKPSDRPGFYHVNDPGYNPQAGPNSPTVGKLLAESAERTRELHIELEEKLILLQTALDQAEQDHQERQNRSSVADVVKKNQ